MKPEKELEDMEESWDPEELFVAIGLLVLEARVPDKSSKGRVLGPHCPPQSGVTEPHTCEKTNELCLRAEKMRKQMNLFWRNKIPVCIEVLGYPKCQHGIIEMLSVDTSSSGSSMEQDDTIVLERWAVHVQSKRTADKDTGSISGRCLIQAIRSYLHFSQLSSWLKSSSGDLPFTVVYRLYVPGEYIDLGFLSNAEQHNFPVTDFGHVAIKVSASSLPRLSTVPILRCKVPEKIFPFDSGGKAKPPVPPGAHGRSLPTGSRAECAGRSLQLAPRSLSPKASCSTKCTDNSVAFANSNIQQARFTKQKCCFLPDEDLMQPGRLSVNIDCEPDLPSKPPNEVLSLDTNCTISSPADKEVVKKECLLERFKEKPLQFNSDNTSANLNVFTPFKTLHSPKVLMTSSTKPECTYYKKRCLKLDSPEDSHDPWEENIIPSKLKKLVKPLSPSEIESYIEHLSHNSPSTSHNTKLEKVSNIKCKFYIGDKPSTSVSPESYEESVHFKSKADTCARNLFPKYRVTEEPFYSSSGSPKESSDSDSNSRQSNCSCTSLPKSLSDIHKVSPYSSSQDSIDKSLSLLTKRLQDFTMHSSCSSNESVSKASDHAADSSNGEQISNGVTVSNGFQNPETNEETGNVENGNSDDFPDCDILNSDISNLNSELSIKKEPNEQSNRDTSILKNILKREHKETMKQSHIEVCKKLCTPNSSQAITFQKQLGRSTSMIFNPATGLPMQSSPAPVKKKPSGKFDFDRTLINVKAIKNALSCSKLETEDTSNSEKENKEKQTLSASAPASTNCLLGNFEESVLNGRIDPVGVVEGFSVEIGASGSFCPKHITLPVTAFFFNLSDDNAPSPYLGHVDLETLGKKGYHIPKSGTVQITLFNPNKTVVKMFVVMYNLNDMPASCQTFLRQRTIYMPIDANSTDPCYLRYLVHLRISSSKTGKLYLHTDLRLIFARDKFEIDSRVAKYELRSFTEGPINPKFSPKR